MGVVKGEWFLGVRYSSYGECGALVAGSISSRSSLIESLKACLHLAIQLRDDIVERCRLMQHSDNTVHVCKQ